MPEYPTVRLCFVQVQWSPSDKETTDCTGKGKDLMVNIKSRHSRNCV